MQVLVESIQKLVRDNDSLRSDAVRLREKVWFIMRVVLTVRERMNEKERERGHEKRNVSVCLCVCGPVCLSACLSA